MSDLPKTAAWKNRDMPEPPDWNDDLADAAIAEQKQRAEHAEGMLIEVSEVCEKAETEAERLRKKNEYLASKRLEDYLAHRDEVERLRWMLDEAVAIYIHSGKSKADGCDVCRLLKADLARRYSAAHPDTQEGT